MIELGVIDGGVDGAHLEGVGDVEDGIEDAKRYCYHEMPRDEGYTVETEVDHQYNKWDGMVEKTSYDEIFSVVDHLLLFIIDIDWILY